MISLIIGGVLVLISIVAWASCKTGSEYYDMKQEIHNELKYERYK